MITMVNKKESNFIECECGARIKGRSKAHAESLMIAHVNSKKHKELMEIKSRRGQQKLT